MQGKVSKNTQVFNLNMAGGRFGWAASTIRLEFWLKFCFLTITQMFLNRID